MAEPKADQQEEQSTEEELRSLYQEIESEQGKLMRVASRMAQRDAQAAEVLRQVSGNVLPLLLGLTATVGGAIAALEDQVYELSEGEAGLSEQDGTDLYQVFVANLKLLDELVAAAGAAGEEDTRQRLAALRALNEEMRTRVVDLAGLEESELAEAGEEPAEPEAEEPAN